MLFKSLSVLLLRFMPVLLPVGISFGLSQDFLLSQLDSRSAEEWIQRLERPDRIAELKIDQVLSLLELKAGDTVADIGAGTGVFSRPFAQALAPSGQVLSVEIDQQLLDYIQKRAIESGITNIQPVLGEFDDPRLPTAVDLAFFHNVIHHIQDRRLYLKNLAAYLKSNGRVVVIDRKGASADRHGHGQGGDQHGQGGEHHVSVQSVQNWLREVGFEQTHQIDLYPDKYFLVFSRSEQRE